MKWRERRLYPSYLLLIVMIRYLLPLALMENIKERRKFGLEPFLIYTSQQTDGISFNRINSWQIPCSFSNISHFPSKSRPCLYTFNCQLALGSSLTHRSPVWTPPRTYLVIFNSDQCGRWSGPIFAPQWSSVRIPLSSDFLAKKN